MSAPSIRKSRSRNMMSIMGIRFGLTSSCMWRFDAPATFGPFRSNLRRRPDLDLVEPGHRAGLDHLLDVFVERALVGADHHLALGGSVGSAGVATLVGLGLDQGADSLGVVVFSAHPDPPVLPDRADAAVIEGPALAIV